MAKEKFRYWLSYASELTQRPLIWEMTRKFDTQFNIKQASITKDVGIMAIEFLGSHDEVEAIVKWFESCDVQVEPVEINTIEG